MKVALLSMYSFDEVRGGTELFTEHLRKAFRDVHVITYSSSSNGKGVDLTRLNLEEARKGAAICRHFRRLHRQNDYDLVIANSTAGWYLGMSRVDVPMMNVYHFTMRGLADQVLKGTPGYLPSKYVSSVFEKLASVGKSSVAVSAKVSRELWSMYRIRSRVIEHGVDMETFRPIPRDEARESIGLDEDGPVGLFVGRADATKRFDILQEVARRRPGIRFLCVTPSGVEGGDIVVHRNVPNEMMPLYYSSADFLLFPSPYESVGYVGLEAMACDLPVVASRTGVFEGLDEESVGRIVPSWEPTEYLEAIGHVLCHTPHPRKVVEERFSMERFLADYQAAARAMAKGRGGG